MYHSKLGLYLAIDIVDKNLSEPEQTIVISPSKVYIERKGNRFCLLAAICISGCISVSAIINLQM